MSDPHRPRYESVVDRQIRIAQERGYFDNLPGKGKPLPELDDPDDDLWWVRRFVEREGLSPEVLLPPSLQLRKEIDRLPATLRELHAEDAARAAVTELNLRIVAWLRTPTGPRVAIGPVNADAAIERWRAERAEVTPARVTESPAEDATVADVPAGGVPVADVRVAGSPARRSRWRRRRR